MDGLVLNMLKKKGKEEWSETAKPRNWVQEVSDLHEKTGKDIVFTEVGYRSTDFAAREPWEYKQERPLNEGLQKRCIESIGLAFQDKEWFKGTLLWNWMPRKDYGGENNTDFTPQHKQAGGIYLK